MNRWKWAGLFFSAVVLLSAANGFSAETGTDATRLDEVMVTATKYETPARDIPASVTVIDRESLLNQNLPNGDIGDALRSVPGITLRRAYSPFPSYANIRGLGSDATVYLVNGIPTDWQISQAIPVERVQRVEIIRGPASALYGANASGGVINIILKEGKGDPTGAVSAGGGSFGRFRGAASSDGQIDRFKYAVAAFYEEADGANVVENNLNPSIHMIDDCDYDKKGAGFDMGYEFSESAKARLFYNYDKNRYTRGRPHVGGDWDYNFAGLIYDQKIGDRLDLMAYAAFRSDDYLHLYDKGGTNYDPKQKRDMDYQETPAEFRASADIGWGNTLTAGFFYNNQETDQTYKDWTTGVRTQENEYKVRTMAGYLQDVWKPVSNMTITAGARYDHWKNYDNSFSSFNETDLEDRSDDHISPKVGIRYNFDDTLSLWCNYGQGFKPPTPDQLYNDATSGGNPRQPNPDLDPETTHSYELGVEKWFKNRLQVNLVGYYNYTDDKILSWFDDTNTWINKNIGKSESYGAEFSLAYYLSDYWTINANYTYNKATIEENPEDKDLEGNYLPFSPKHKANLGVTYSHPKNFTLSGYVRYLSKQYTNDANTTRNSAGESLVMPDSFVVDLKASKHFTLSGTAVKAMDLSIAVDNLFNEDYRSYYMYEDPGTSVYMEAKVVF